MARVTGGKSAHARHKKIIKKAKGYQSRRKNCHRIALQAVERAGQYAYRDRRAKKRNFRALWIQRINAGARQHGMTYSQLMNGLKKAGVELDRKSLSEIAIHSKDGFKDLVNQAQDALKKAA